MPISAPRIIDLPPAWERSAAASARALLVTERDTLEQAQKAADDATAAVLSSLETVREDDVDQLKRRALGAMGVAAGMLRSSLRYSLVLGRQDARKAARDRLGSELELASSALGVDAFDAPPFDDATEDVGHAEAATDAYVAAWRGAVLAAVARSILTPDTPVAKDVRDAVKMQDHRVRRIVATENSRAFNDEHAFGVQWIGQNYTPCGERLTGPARAAAEAARLGVGAEEYQRAYAFGDALTREERLRRAFRRGPDGIPTLVDADVLDAPTGPELPAWAEPLVGTLMRRWDARNDGRTCPFCRAMNGALTLLGKPFTNGYEPGGPHPNCRCTGTLIVLTPKIILENERRAPQKGRAELEFEKRLPQDARNEAAARALIKVKR